MLLFGFYRQVAADTVHYNTQWSTTDATHCSFILYRSQKYFATVHSTVCPESNCSGNLQPAKCNRSLTAEHISVKPWHYNYSCQINALTRN